MGHPVHRRPSPSVQPTASAPPTPSTHRSTPVLVSDPHADVVRELSARHTELLARLAAAELDGWSATALHACLDHLRTSTVTEAARVSIVDAWTDGPDAICIVYRPPFDEGRVVGLRRTRQSAIEVAEWRLGDLTTWGYDMAGADGGIDAVAFGWNVADFDVGEPMGYLVTVLRYDRADVGWWGNLDDALPEPPA